MIKKSEGYYCNPLFYLFTFMLYFMKISIT
jgi:hypothetical protein